MSPTLKGFVPLSPKVILNLVNGEQHNCIVALYCEQVLISATALWITPFGPKF
jgi:hypothetical protein